MPRTALFPGSFDPVTNGHLDIVRQAARLAERLVLAIGTHPGKAPLFAAEERRAMVEETVSTGSITGGTLERVVYLDTDDWGELIAEGDPLDADAMNRRMHNLQPD